MRREEITKSQIIDAFHKLKSHIYYDTSELFQRRKLAEFETDVFTDNFLFDNTYNESLFGIGVKVPLEKKFDKIVDWINNFGSKKNKLDKRLDEIGLIFLPKKFNKDDEPKNFVTNQRVSDAYSCEKVTVFSDLPIELHLVSILWLMVYGYKLDAELDNSCAGNRLILNKDKTAIVKGSGLFKPYFTQYQKWRDDSVTEAKRKLQNGNAISFINLDLKDYFYSVKLDFGEVENVIFGKGEYKGNSGLHEIFKIIHLRFTNKLFEKKHPYPELEGDLDGRTVLPIGMPSSYVLANWYLREFDKRVNQLIPHVYYSRYVDDILIVVNNPDFDFHKNEKCESIKFSFKKYQEKEGDEKVNFTWEALDRVERYLLETFYPIIKLVSTPEEFKDPNKKDNGDRIFHITCVDGAYFQAAKTLVYFFDPTESTAPIDKLKQDLEERSSEFRDFPDDSFGDGDFDEQAYHLIFDGTEGKIRTLKDYKENRYGLSVFLANRIFASLRRKKPVDKKESEKLLKLFKGINNLEHFRLWEKVFTYFIVNDDRAGFVAFYKHTYDQITKLNIDKAIGRTAVINKDVSGSLFRYFDIALELSLSLNPQFIEEGTKEFEDFEFFQNINTTHAQFIAEIKLTNAKSHYIRRFRRCNLIRHHYVAHPLLNYTKAARGNKLSLVDKHLPSVQKFGRDRLALSEASLSFSPRRVKFWECCIMILIQRLLVEFDKNESERDEIYLYTDITADNIDRNDESNPKEFHSFLLEEAFQLYKKINHSHFPTESLDPSKFFTRSKAQIDLGTDAKPVFVNEINIDSKSKFERPIKISIANTEVAIKNIEASLKGKPVLSHNRYQVFAKLLKESRLEGANMFVLPEFSVPYEFIPSMAKYAEKNQMAIIAGLEHWTVDDVAFNFIVTIVPIEVDGVKDAVVLYRLKNHYAHIEESIIRGYHLIVPKPIPYRYDLINWRNLYFTAFYCFELADSFHRSLFRSKIDLMVASEWNKDTPYFSNIVEALSRDLHCYMAQVNTSQFGDSRLTQPSETSRKDLLKLKGGKNHAILVGEIELAPLREFQLKTFDRVLLDKTISHNEPPFKPLPPDWDTENVKRRVDNKRVFKNDEE